MPVRCLDRLSHYPGHVVDIGQSSDFCGNSRVSHLTAPSLAPGGGKMRDPGNQVDLQILKTQ